MAAREVFAPRREILAGVFRFTFAQQQGYHLPPGCTFAWPGRWSGRATLFQLQGNIRRRKLTATRVSYVGKRSGATRKDHGSVIQPNARCLQFDDFARSVVQSEKSGATNMAPAGNESNCETV